MVRFLGAILVGALGGMSADLLEQHHLRMVVIALGLIVGLAAGLVASWRTPPFAAGLRNGLGVGIIASALLIGGAAHSGLLLSNAAHTSQLAQLAQLSWLSWLSRLPRMTHLTLIAALFSGALCVALSVAVGGLTSGWTGYHRPLAQPEPTTAATPLGPLPTPA